MKFAFKDFALGSCSLDCSSSTCTYVEVYDGPSESSPLLARFCYGSAQEEKVSSGNQMFVKFHAGFSLGPGFEAEYSETTDSPSPTVAKPSTTAKPPTSNYLHFLFSFMYKCLHIYDRRIQLTCLHCHPVKYFGRLQLKAFVQKGRI